MNDVQVFQYAQTHTCSHQIQPPGVHNSNSNNSSFKVDWHIMLWLRSLKTCYKLHYPVPVFLPYRAPGIGIGFRLVDGLSVRNKGIVHLVQSRVAPETSNRQSCMSAVHMTPRHLFWHIKWPKAVNSDIITKPAHSNLLISKAPETELKDICLCCSPKYICLSSIQPLTFYPPGFKYPHCPNLFSYEVILSELLPLAQVILGLREQSRGGTGKTR